VALAPRAKTPNDASPADAFFELILRAVGSRGAVEVRLVHTCSARLCTPSRACRPPQLESQTDGSWGEV
jgi:hypothetical protein